MHTASPSPLPDPAAQLLVACAASQLCEDMERLMVGVDWDRFDALCRFHRVTPLVHGTLASIPGIPEQTAERFRLRLRAGAARTLYLCNQLGELAGRISAAGYPVMGYKGVALAVQAYGSTFQREPGDIDLFVKEAHVAPVLKILTEQEFVRCPDYHGSSEYHLHLARRDKLSLELHWAFAPRTLPFRIAHSALWEKRVTVRFEGQMSVDTFCLEHAIPILCFHASKHSWSRLCWLCDVDRLVRSSTGIDWGELIGVSQGSGVARITQIGLSIASDLMNTPLPKAVEVWIQRDPVVQRLARLLVNQLLSGDTSERGVASPSEWCLSTRERFRDRLPYHRDRIALGIKKRLLRVSSGAGA